MATKKNASTIQEEIDNAISLLLKKKIKTMGSGRTDTGVHAISQVAHFTMISLLIILFYIESIRSFQVIYQLIQ